jgi:hypothetical protein
MKRDGIPLTAERIASARSQLAGDLAHLQKLWADLRQLREILADSAVAYYESRKLLERIDGMPHRMPRGQSR